MAYLDSGLGEVDPAGQVLPDEGVGVVRPLEHSLQSLQLAAVEGGPVPALLPLLLLLRVHLLVCRQKKKEAMSQKLYGNTEHFSLQLQRRWNIKKEVRAPAFTRLLLQLLRLQPEIYKITEHRRI